MDIESKITLEEFSILDPKTGLVMNLDFNYYNEDMILESIVEEQITQIQLILSPYEGRYHKVLTSLNITNIELFKALRDQQICAVGPIRLSETDIPQSIIQ